MGRQKRAARVIHHLSVAYLGFALTQNITLIAGLFVFYGLYQGIFRTVGKAFASQLGA